MTQSTTPNTTVSTSPHVSPRTLARQFGPQALPHEQGVRFRLWAPSAKQVEVVFSESGQEKNIQLQAQDNGWFAETVQSAKPGVRYQFRINGDLKVPDPASRYQPEDAHGWSQVVDEPQRSPADCPWQGRPWEEVILYELHVGTFTPEGTFQGVKNKLDYLKALGVTAIELMPIADFPGQRNWGYDGVLQFAPDSRYGTPQDLQDLIHTAHEKGLMVFLDVVYNHFGPDGNYLHVYARDFFTDRYQTPWGAALNYEGPNEVRQFFIENALYWLNGYGFDGLRLDAVHAIYDDSPTHFLHELARQIRSQIEPGRHVHLVLENDDNASRFITQNPHSPPGFNAQWNDDFHHAAHVIATGEETGYYEDYAQNKTGKTALEHFARCLAEGFAYQGDPSPYRNGAIRGEKSSHLPPTAFVNFIQNHDQIGNRAFGDRLNQTASPDALKALLACLLLAPGIPLLYMGQEWETEKPFQFFCDFDGELARLVTEGRRKEFAKFPEFAKPENRARIPDPAALSTFEHSKLDWNEHHQPAHQNWLRFYQHLLSCRQRAIIPLLSQSGSQPTGQHGYEVFETSGIQVQWRLSNEKRLQLTANLGDRPLTAPPKVLDNLQSEQLALIYHSEGHSQKDLKKDMSTGLIPAWSVIWHAGQAV